MSLKKEFLFLKNGNTSEKKHGTYRIERAASTYTHTGCGNAAGETFRLEICRLKRFDYLCNAITKAEKIFMDDYHPEKQD